MGAIKLSDSVYSVGVLNPSMRVFDVIMKTEYGTSYNAYLLTGEKNVLIDTVHARFFEEYIENVRSVIDPSKIDYIIVNHCEPDHTGSLARLLELAPDAQILATPAGKIYLPLITNKPMPTLKAVKNDETLALGGGKTLRFIHAAFLHWPDTMFTWFESEKTVFTCDFLGTHFCEPTMNDRKFVYPDLYEQSFSEYYTAIFSPFKPHVLNGLEKLGNLDAETVCPSHGPILHKDAYLETAKKLYEEWSKPSERTKKIVPVFYCSAYGYTGILADEIARGILSVLPDVQVPLYDLTVTEPSQLACVLDEADSFCIGTPTINKDALPLAWELIGNIEAMKCKGKKAAVFGSYGWSGEAVPAISARLNSLGIDTFEDGHRCRFKPSETECKEAFAYGERFASSLQ